MPLKVCSDCKTPKPQQDFSKRYGKYANGRRLSICKQCKSLRSRKWMFQNPQRYLQKEKIRLRTKRRVCATCNKPNDVHWYNIDNITALYHIQCAKDEFAKRRIILPDRMQELRRIAESVA